jgi:hypothetical protein
MTELETSYNVARNLITSVEEGRLDVTAAIVRCGKLLKGSLDADVRLFWVDVREDLLTRWKEANSAL